MSGTLAAAPMISFLIWLLAAGSAFAGPLEDGRAAWAKADYGRAMTLLRPLADKGSAMAQGLVGRMYDDGLGVPQDKAKAVEYYEKAAAQGDSTARNNLGVMLQAGDGVPADPVRAANLYEAAAASGNATGQYNFGWALVHGMGRTADPEAGYRYYRLAAAQGHVAAGDSLPNPDLPDGDRISLSDFTVTVEPGNGQPLYKLTPTRTLPDIHFPGKADPRVSLILDLGKPTRTMGDFIDVYLKWDERRLPTSRLNYALVTIEVDCNRHRFRETVVYNLFKASAGGGGGIGAPDHPDWSWPAKGGPYDLAMTRACQFKAFIGPNLEAMAAKPAQAPASEVGEPKDAERTKR
ncbi:MAG: hypothetical protein CFE28_04180 [Alphaproteobacteria bacterium PA2]|nr:MAG: hypothetical protein CFE28_04180 [Alphaproteobacteria bacterium PA2]